jgi:hypothetical protein
VSANGGTREEPETSQQPAVASEPAAPSGRRPSRTRSIIVWALIVVSTVVACAASVTLWVKRQVLDTDQWTKTSSELLANPTIRGAVAAYVVDQLYENVDVTGRLSQDLPANVQQLAAPLAAALRGPATEAVDRLLASDRFQNRWEQINRTAHQALVNVLEGHTRVGSTANGVVTLNLGALVKDVGARVGIPSSVLDKIPPDAGQVVVARSSKLHTAQRAYRAIHVIGALAFIVVVLLYLLAVYLAIDRRRTVRNIGWAIVILALVLFTARRGAEHYVTSLITDQANRKLAGITITIATSLLRTMAWATLSYGLMIVLWACLLGPSRLALAARRALAPAVNQVGVAVGSTLAVFLLLLLWQPTPAFTTTFGVLGIAALLATGVVLLRRRTVAEFPDASFGATVAGTRAWFEKRRHRSAPAPDAVQGTTDLAALERLATMHDNGVLSDDEYRLAKSQLLSPVGAGVSPDVGGDAGNP